MTVDFVYLLLWWAAVKRGAIVGHWRWAWLVFWLAAGVVDGLGFSQIGKGLAVAGAILVHSVGMI